MPERDRGVFVAFEGGEGTGKSTQARLLAGRLDALLTHEPGGCEIGKKVRAIVLDPANEALDGRAEALLMAADRAQHVAEVIEPALAAGRAVVTDRYVGSSLAYQGHGRQLGVDEIAALSHFATGGLLPDVVILLDVPTDVVADRMNDEPDRLEREPAQFHRRVLAGFHELAAEHDHWAVVDGRGTIAEVAARIDAVLAQRGIEL